MSVKIETGFSEWIKDPRRARSPHVDFGVWWRLPGSRYTWRVSWIENTGELYAREQAPDSDRFILLGLYPTLKEVEAAMAGWEESDQDLTQYFPAIGE